MRAGTRSQSKRRWTPRGHRPVCRVKLGYEFCNLYAALAPATGNLIALILPDMSKDSFSLFMDYFSKQTRKCYGSKPVLLIADQASTHQKDICEQKRAALVLLSRTCPELNPVERFFEELRKELADHIFDTLDQLEDYLCVILKKYYKHPKLIVQLCHYPYIRTS